MKALRLSNGTWAAVLAFVLVGCVEARQWRDQSETSQLVAAGGPLRDLGFDYAPAAVEPDLRREAESDSHLVHRARYQSVGDNGQDRDLVTALYY